MDLDTKSPDKIDFETYRFADFGRLAAGLFHDFATPLNVVRLNLKLLHDQHIALPQPQKSAFQQAIKRASASTAHMTQFLQLAREQLSQPTVLRQYSLTQTAKHAAKLVTESHPTRNQKIHIFSPQEVTFFGSPSHFFQVLFNLLSNAMDATECSPIKKIRIRIQKKEKEILVTVSDSGEGIPQESISSVFEPFFSTKSNSTSLSIGHTGLGLFLVQEIVEEKLRGAIECQSIPNKGTTFTIHLPQRSSLPALKGSGAE